MDHYQSQERHYTEDSCTSTPIKSSSYAGLYQLLRRIQIGGQAGIYLSSKFGTFYALKIYNDGQTCEREFQNQVKILKRLNYKGIVPIVQIINNALFKWEEQQQRMANIIVMPYVENGDLFQWVSKNGAFTQNTGRYFAKKLIETFRYLTQQNILHQDIKPENILIDHIYQPLLVDFGFSNDRRQKDSRFIGDIRYASPQVVKHIEYTEKSEIYSFGILLFFIITGKYPYGMARVSDANYRLLLERKYKDFWGKVELSIKKQLSNEFKQTFLKMISHNASERPTFQNILQHSWLKIEETSSQEYQRYMESIRISKDSSE